MQGRHRADGRPRPAQASRPARSSRSSSAARRAGRSCARRRRRCSSSGAAASGGRCKSIRSSTRSTAARSSALAQIEVNLPPFLQRAPRAAPPRPLGPAERRITTSPQRHSVHGDSKKSNAILNLLRSCVSDGERNLQSRKECTHEQAFRVRRRPHQGPGGPHRHRQDGQAATSTRSCSTTSRCGRPSASGTACTCASASPSNIFRYFSHEEVFNRISEVAPNDRVRWCLERDDDGDGRLLAVTNPTAALMPHDDLIGPARPLRRRRRQVHQRRRQQPARAALRRHVPGGRRRLPEQVHPRHAHRRLRPAVGLPVAAAAGLQQRRRRLQPGVPQRVERRQGRRRRAVRPDARARRLQQRGRLRRPAAALRVGGEELGVGQRGQPAVQGAGPAAQLRRRGGRPRSPAAGGDGAAEADGSPLFARLPPHDRRPDADLRAGQPRRPVGQAAADAAGGVQGLRPAELRLGGGDAPRRRESATG